MPHRELRPEPVTIVLPACNEAANLPALIEGLELASSSALINAELAARAQRRGIIPIEVPVHHFPRRHGRQSGGSARGILRAWREFRELDRRLKEGQPSHG